MFAPTRLAALGKRPVIIGMLTRSKAASAANVRVKHQPDKQMFSLDVDGREAILQYQLKKNHIILEETVVPPELEGRGLGKVLAKEALNYVAKNDFRMEVNCTFIEHYINKYAPEYKKYLAKL